jgi:hypothetical protein
MATWVCGCDQEVRDLDSAALPVWVEIWVENRGGLECVEAGAAQSGSVHLNAGYSVARLAGSIGAPSLPRVTTSQLALLTVRLPTRGLE